MLNSEQWKFFFLYLMKRNVIHNKRYAYCRTTEYIKWMELRITLYSLTHSEKYERNWNEMNSMCSALKPLEKKPLKYTKQDGAGNGKNLEFHLTYPFWVDFYTRTLFAISRVECIAVYFFLAVTFGFHCFALSMSAFVLLKHQALRH